MFGPRRRRASFRDPIDWTEYRWESRPWHGGGHWHPVRPRRLGRGSWTGVVLAGLAMYAAARLFTGLNARNGSWARKGLYALLLLMIASAFTRSRRGRWSW